MRILILRVVGAAIGAIFVYAGILKALDPARFAIDILNFRIVPWACAVPIALYLPWLEIFCGTVVIARRLHRGALWVLTGLMILFIGALISAKMRGLDVDCGCFGHASAAGSTLPIWRDFALLAALSALLLLDRERR